MSCSCEITFTRFVRFLTVSRFAHTFITLRGVDALTVTANARPQDALVHFYQVYGGTFAGWFLRSSVRRDDISGTQLPVFIWKEMARTSNRFCFGRYLRRVADNGRTRLPNLAPCWRRSNSLFWRAAWQGGPNRNRSDFGRWNTAPDVRLEWKRLGTIGTRTCVDTDAELLVLALDEAGIAQADVPAHGIDASSVLADVFFEAFVSIVTLVRRWVSGLTWRTFASKRTDAVDTFSSLAEIRNGFAFVDV